MSTFNKVFLGFLLVISSISVVQAGSLDQAEALYRFGEYEKARTVAEAVGGADGFALAARAILTETDLKNRKERSRETIEGAIALAQKSLDLEPDNFNGHIQMAVGIGLNSRLMGQMSAHFGGHGKLSRDHMLAALAIDPDSPWAHTAYGAWNIEVVGRAPSGIAKDYGASEAKGMKSFEKALEVAPEGAIFRYLYGLQLIAYEPEDYHDKIIELFTATATLRADTHVAKVFQGRAAILLALMQANDHKKAKRLTAVYQGRKSK